MNFPNGSFATAVCYVRVASSEPQSSARFASDILGLQRVAEANGEIAFRSDHRFRTLSFCGGGDDASSLGVEIWDDQALHTIEERLRAAGFQLRAATLEECKSRYVQAAVLAQDGSCNAIDLVVRPMQSGRRYFPSRDAGVVQFHGGGMRSTDVARDLEFWKILGATVSDWVGDISYLRIDGLHHRIALYPSNRRGILYAAFEVESLDNIMQNSYFMQERQVKIVQGPGRQPASQQLFLHIDGPDGIIYSYVSGMTTLGGGKHLARQYRLASESLCAWGSESKDVPELCAEPV
jgi:2,3-dihydroxy-p-cumate/2,3-dihydroxybenzoate 3,4-dioxygenase